MIESSRLYIAYSRCCATLSRLSLFSPLATSSLALKDYGSSLKAIKIVCRLYSLLSIRLLSISAPSMWLARGMKLCFCTRFEPTMCPFHMTSSVGYTTISVFGQSISLLSVHTLELSKSHCHWMLAAKSGETNDATTQATHIPCECRYRSSHFEFESRPNIIRTRRTPNLTTGTKFMLRFPVIRARLNRI